MLVVVELCPEFKTETNPSYTFQTLSASQDNPYARMALLGKRSYTASMVASSSRSGGKRARRTYRRVYKRATIKRGMRVYGKDRVPFPKVLDCRLHLNIQTTATSTTGSFGGLTAALRLNDLSDPQGAMGATKPRWTTQLGALYGKYTVYGAKVTVDASNAEKIGGVGMGCYDGSAPASMLELDERENCESAVIDAAANGGVTQVHFERYYDFPKIVGIPKSQYLNEDDYKTTLGSSPAAPGNIVYWNFWHQAYAAQTSSTSVKIHVEFFCHLTCIEDPADS